MKLDLQCAQTEKSFTLTFRLSINQDLYKPLVNYKNNYKHPAVSGDCCAALETSLRSL